MGFVSLADSESETSPNLRFGADPNPTAADAARARCSASASSADNTSDMFFHSLDETVNLEKLTVVTLNSQCKNSIGFGINSNCRHECNDAIELNRKHEMTTYLTSPTNYPSSGSCESAVTVVTGSNV